MRQLRRFWWRRVRRWHGELCHRCGRPWRPVVWRANDDLWARVHHGYELLCPACFTWLALAQRVSLLWLPCQYGYGEGIVTPGEEP